MIYLFNSAYYEKYQINVHNTLFLPINCTNEYRYRYEGTDYINVSKDFLKEIKKIGRCEDVAIIFIDRFGTDPDGLPKYKFYPLRLAKFVTYQLVNDQIHITVKLGRFVFPKDNDEFNNLLTKTLSNKGLPSFKQYVKNPNDGFYAIRANNIFKNTDKYLFDNSAWSSCVDNISNTEMYKSTANEQRIFVCAEVKDDSNKLVQPKLKNYMGRYCLDPDKKYNISISYKYPILDDINNRGMTGHLTIEPPDCLTAIDDIGHEINVHRDMFRFCFQTKKANSAGAIRFKYEANGENRIICPDASLSVDIKRSLFANVFLIILVLVFILCDTLTGLDLKQTINSPMTTKITNMLNTTSTELVNWIKIGSSFLKTACLLGFYKILGEKPL